MPRIALLLTILACTSTEVQVQVQEAQNTAISAVDRPPDILFIVLDTVRADRLGTYGGPHPTSPALSRLARSGVLFEDVTSVGSWTWPSHASLFTGEPPWVHGAHFAPPEEGAIKMGPDPFHASTLRTDLPTLAEVLDQAGYQTHALSANRLISADFGLTRGFLDSRTFRQDADVLAAAEQLLQTADQRPLLLFANLFGAHAPFEIQSVPWLEGRTELQEQSAPLWLQPFLRRDGTRINLMRSPSPGKPIGAFSYMQGDLPIPPEGLELLRDVYDGELRAVDYYMGQLIEAWTRERGEQGVIIVTSDHGEMLGERQLLEHGRTVAPELLRVPLVVRAPGFWPSGSRVSQPVQPHHLYESLLYFAGLQTDNGPIGRAVHGGADKAPILAASWRDHFWEKSAGDRFDQGYRFYREGHEVVIFGIDRGVEYYDLSLDPDLLTDRADAHPDRVDSLSVHARPLFLEESQTRNVQASPEAIDQLQALGYIQRSDEQE